MTKRTVIVGILFCVVILSFFSMQTDLCAESTVSKTNSSMIQLPDPFGVNLTFYYQKQDYKIKQLDLSLPGDFFSQAENLIVQNKTNSYHIKIDYWLLPFLNVHALIGLVDGQTTVNIENIELGQSLSLNEIVIDYDGLVYGGGLTIAGGWDKFFAAVTYHITESDLDVATSSANASIITPKIGVRTKIADFWVGATYQNATEKHEGFFNIPYFGSTAFSVELEEKEPWNYLAGMNAAITNHMMMTMEGGFGERSSALVILSYRF